MNDRGIHLETAGSAGTPILLLHGIGGSSASFAAQLGPLSHRHRVLAWDAPGYGASADPEQAPGMSGYAAAAAAVIDEYAPAHLLGVSWGGVIATRAAAEHPERVRSLTLADSTRGSGRTGDGAAKMRARTVELGERGGRAFAEERGPRLLSPDADTALVETVVNTMATVRLPGYAFAAESMAGTDHSGLVGKLAVPTLVIVGAMDRVTGVAESRVLADGIPGARLEIVPSAGHAANQEQPEKFNRAVLDFVDLVDTAVMTGGT